MIKYNHIHEVGQGMLSDMGGIYTCSTRGSRISHNIVHDVTRRDYGGWGIYTDEGSHDMLIQNNLLYRDMSALQTSFCHYETAAAKLGSLVAIAILSLDCWSIAR